MKCNCIDRIEKGIVEHLNSEGAEKANIKNLAIVFGGNHIDGELSEQLMIPFTIKGSKKPYSKVNGHDTNVTSKHCPFCGNRSAQPEGQYDDLPVLKDPE